MESSEIDFQAPCKCGALGDHQSTVECLPMSSVTAEISGPRADCLEAVGNLRAVYFVNITHEWQDPQTSQWVFHLELHTSDITKADKNLPPALTPSDTILAVLHDALGLEVDRVMLYAATGLDDDALDYILGFMVKNGTIECVRPGIYRKNE
jgi:hypothetical protein